MIVLSLLKRSLLNFLKDIAGGTINSKKDAIDAYLKKSSIIKNR